MLLAEYEAAVVDEGLTLFLRAFIHPHILMGGGGDFKRSVYLSIKQTTIRLGI